MFTINVNTEMNYWPVEVASLAELHLPLMDLIDRMRVTGARTAREHYGARGFVAHHNTDLWADTLPLDNVYCGLWPAGAAWLAHHAWEHYAFDPDDGYLRTRAYPILKEAAEFALDYLVPDPEQRQSLLFGPSLSPENQYFDAQRLRSGLCMAPASDTQIVAGLFDRVVSAAEILGVDEAFRTEVQAAREKLPAMRIGRHGQLQEWLVDYEEWEPGHRHVSHLFGLYPDSQISPRRTPELARAARISLERRLAAGGGGTGWSRAWVVLLWARLGEGDLAHEHLLELLRSSTVENLFDTHPPQGTNPLTVFQDRRQPRRRRRGVRDAAAVPRRHRAPAGPPVELARGSVRRLAASGRLRRVRRMARQRGACGPRSAREAGRGSALLRGTGSGPLRRRRSRSPWPRGTTEISVRGARRRRLPT